MLNKVALRWCNNSIKRNIKRSTYTEGVPGFAWFYHPEGGAGDGCGVYRPRAGAETLIRESCRDGYSSGKPFQPKSRQNPTCCEPRRRATPKAKSNARAKTLADATVKSHPNAAKCATLGWGTHRPKKQSAKNKNHLSFPAASKAACGAGSNGMPEGMPFFGVEKGNTHTILCG